MGVVRVDGRRQDRTDSRAEVHRIKERAQIDEEWIVDCTREYPDSVVQIVNSLVEQRLVVRHSLWSHVGGNGKQRLSIVQAGRIPALDHGHRIGLAQAQTL